MWKNNLINELKNKELEQYASGTMDITEDGEYFKSEDVYKLLEKYGIVYSKELSFGEKTMGLNRHRAAEMNRKEYLVKQHCSDLIDLLCPNGEDDISTFIAHGGLSWPFRQAAFQAIILAEAAINRFLRL